MDVAIAALATRQHGVARTAHLLNAQLSPAGISRRVARGRLHRLYHGVYAIGHTALSFEGACLAGVFAAGDGAALGRLAAARLMQLWRYKLERIDVVTPRQMRPVRAVRFHQARNLDPRDITVVRGIPVTTVARTLVDLTEELTKWELTNIIHEAAYHDIFSEPATRAAMARANGRRQVTKLELAIQMHNDGSAGTRSRGELRFLIANERAGNPEPLVNVQLNGYEVDFHWPDLKLALEVDGPGHERPRTHNEDERKEAWCEAGYRVLRDPQLALRTASVASS